MSQSILISDLESNQEKFNKSLLNSAYDYNLHKRFGIGVEVDQQKLNYLRLMNKALCRQNPQLKKYIEDKIRGKTKECDRKLEIKEKEFRYLKKYCDPEEDSPGFNSCELRLQW